MFVCLRLCVFVCMCLLLCLCLCVCLCWYVRVVCLDVFVSCFASFCVGAIGLLCLLLFGLVWSGLFVCGVSVRVAAFVLFCSCRCVFAVRVLCCGGLLVCVALCFIWCVVFCSVFVFVGLFCGGCAVSLL